MLRLQLFGRPLIEHSDKLFEGFRSRKIEALFYYLVVMPGVHQRTKLAALLWSEVPEENARRNLRYALWSLRPILGDIPLHSDRLSLTLPENDKLRTDIKTFTHLLDVNHKQVDETEMMSRRQSAVDLYRGEFLEGFELDDAPLFEEWIHEQRLRFNNIIVEKLTGLADYYVTQSQLPEAIATTQKLLQLDPWQEAAHRQLLTSLVLVGRRDTAVLHYQTFAQRLKEKLGIEPDPETVALIERIHAGQPMPEENRGALTSTKNGDTSDKRKLAIPFVGRHQEYIELIKHWENAIQAESGLLLIRGATGVGKTRLVEELSRYVSLQGGMTLKGDCYEFSGSLPYHALAMALESQVANIKAGNWFADHIWLHELEQLLPELRPPRSEPALHLLGRQEAGRYQLFEAVAQLIKAMTQEQPLLLVIDDLHWADAEMLDLLGYLARRLSTASLLIVGTYRPGEVTIDHALVALRRPLYNAGLDQELILNELRYETIVELVATLDSAGSYPDLPQFLYEISRGNPFILFETLNEMRELGWLKVVANEAITFSLPSQCLIDTSMMHHSGLHLLCQKTAVCQSVAGQSVFYEHTALTDGMVAGIPQQEKLQLGTVKDRIARRIARLPAKSQQLLSIAALSGHAFDARLLQLASGMSMLKVLDYLEDWVARHLVKEVDYPDHQTTSPLGYPSNNSFQYDFSHELIHSVAYHHLSPVRKQLFHLQLGLALEELYTGHIEYIVERLASHFHQAREAPKALHYLHKAGQQARAIYALSIAWERFQQALVYWDQVYASADIVPRAAWRQRWDLLYSLNEVNRMLGQQSKQDLMLETIIDEVAYQGDEQDKLRMIEQQLAQLKYSADLKQRRQLAREGLQLAHTLNDSLAEANFLQAWADCDLDMGNHEEAEDNYKQAINHFLSLGETSQTVLCLIGLGRIHMLSNRFGQALSHFEQAVNAAQSAGCQDVLVWALNSIAELFLYIGNLESAITVSRNALEVCEKIGFNVGMAAALVTQGTIHRLNNNLEAAQHLLENAWAITLQTGQSLRMADVQCSLGHLCLAQQKYRHALVYFENTEALSGSFYHGRAIEARSYRAIAHLKLGELDEALVASHHAMVWLIGREHVVDAPQRVCWNQHEVMLAHWEDVEAQEALVKAYRLLREQLEASTEAYPASVSETLIRNQFLSRLSWNQEIITMWDMLPLTNSHSALHFAG